MSHIRIDDETKSRLDSISNNKKDTYDSIIQKLLNGEDAYK
jgi:hypothetical protein